MVDWLVGLNIFSTNYLQIWTVFGQIYLHEVKYFSNLVYLIKYQYRVGVTGPVQCDVTTAAAPPELAIFDRKCPYTLTLSNDDDHQNDEEHDYSLNWC